LSGSSPQRFAKILLEKLCDITACVGRGGPRMNKQRNSDTDTLASIRAAQM